MSTSPFILSGPWAKLTRGKDQLQTFQTMLREALDPKKEPVTLDGQVQIMAERNRYDGRHIFAGVVWVETLPEITEDMSLLLGDGLHNIRASLDHLAWYLVTQVAHKRLNARQAREVAFPMVKKSASFYTEARRRRLPGVNDELLALAEWFQPYHRDKWGRAMRLLRDLNDIDKHRFIIPGLMVPRDAEFDLKIKGGTTTAMKWFPMGRALHPKANFVRVVGLSNSPTTKPSMEVKGEISLFPEFPGKRRVNPTLDQIAWIAEQVFGNFELALRGGQQTLPIELPPWKG